MRKLNIGITIGLSSPDESLWVNGIKQNALFLLKTLSRCDSVGHVRLLNTSAVPLTDALPWDRRAFPTAAWHDGVDDLDVVIELGAQIGADETESLRTRGTRLVSYCCGSEYVMAVENMLFNRPMWSGRLFVNRHFDELWFIPQVAPHTLPFLAALRHAPAYVVPFVWDPVFIEQAWLRALDGAASALVPPGPARLAVMEPNINTVKTCVMPILIAEEAHRMSPQRIASLTVCNAMDLAFGNLDFQQLMHELDIVKAGKATFTGRHEVAPFLAEHANVVVSHQWGNPLNYFYLDVSWLGIPLIHNADLCADIGHHYPGFDVKAAARLLLSVATEAGGGAHYREIQRHRLTRFTAENPELVRAYDEHLCRLMHRR